MPDHTLLILPIALPLAGALALTVVRRPGVLPWLVAVATAASVAGLALALAGGGSLRHALGGWGVPLGIGLRADPLAVAFLGLTALVGLAVTGFAARYFADAEQARRYWPLWLALWAALNALFLAADLFNLYVTLELLGLAAVALTALTPGRAARRAAMDYLLVGLLGSMGYLLGVALLYGRYGVLDLDTLAAMMAGEPATWVALALMSVSLLLKAAAFPLHFWLPPAHGGAPAPVSAVLSALVVKAALYLLLRLWLELFPGVIGDPAAVLVGALGAGAVLWGSWRALTAERLKRLAAYSTVAQLGYLLLAFPLLRDAAVALTAWSALVFLALSHGLAKAALFLAAGNVQQAAGHDRLDGLAGLGERLPLTAFAIALAGMALVGLPPSGGFLGKWLLLNAAFASGQWWWALVMAAGTLMAAGYVFRVLRLALIHHDGAPLDAAPDRRALAPLALGLAATALLGLAGAPLADWLAGSAPVSGELLQGGRS
jgi:multicomponent Na+:H+ antiporter subunit D